MAKGPRKTARSVRKRVSFTFLFLAIRAQIKALASQIRAGIYAPMLCSLLLILHRVFLRTSLYRSGYALSTPVNQVEPGSGKEVTDIKS